jgi:hypothetical protein
MPRTVEPRPMHFKERMRGHVAFDHLTDLVTTTVDGTGWVEIELQFRMFVDDVHGFWKGDHVGQLEGIVDCRELGGPCRVRRGHFQLMTPVDGNPRHQHMLYHAQFTDSQGRELTLNGYKEVITGEFNALEDTTAMLTRIHDGWTDDSQKWSANAIAAGVLRISVVDVITQLFTFRADGAGPVGALRTIMSFIWHFNMKLWTVYGIGRRRRQLPPA